MQSKVKARAHTKTWSKAWRRPRLQPIRAPASSPHSPHSPRASQKPARTDIIYDISLNILICVMGGFINILVMYKKAVGKGKYRLMKLMD